MGIIIVFILQHRAEVTAHYLRSPEISKEVWIKRRRGKSEIVSGLSALSKDEESQQALVIASIGIGKYPGVGQGAHKGQNETPKKSHHLLQHKESYRVLCRSQTWISDKTLAICFREEPRHFIDIANPMFRARISIILFYKRLIRSC